MKIIKIKSVQLAINSYSSDAEIVTVSIKDLDSDSITTEKVPYSDISKRRSDLPLPSSFLDKNGLIKSGLWLDVVKLHFHDGRYRYALDETKFDDVYIKEDETDIIKELIADMKIGELDPHVELKASFVHPANPEDPDDHNFQIKEIIKQVQAFANSRDHMGKIWVGISDRDGIRTVTGIQQEFQVFKPNCNAELFRCHFLNQLKLQTSETLLLSVDFKYVYYHGKTVARILVDYRGDVVFFGKSRELNVRIGSSMHRLEDTSAYLEFIRNFDNKRVTVD